MQRKKPLEGLRVLELGTLVAAPFAGKIFAEFGAEVIKVEAPGTGDPLRNWRAMHEDSSIWWYVQARNKKSITVDMRLPEGQEVVRSLVEKVDVIIENFRPGTLAKWGLDYETLSKINPGLIMASISGYGQTGPYRSKPGFGSVGEAIGGLRYLTGFPDRPPVRVGIAIGDIVAGMYAVIGTMFALHARNNHPEKRGQWVDVALYESVFSLMEGILPEFDLKGIVRERTGSTLPGIAPSNTYECSDGKYIVIGANSDSIFKRMMYAIGRGDLAEDPQYADNQGRAERADFLDEVIGNWTKQYPLKEVQKRLDEAAVPVGPIYSIEDIVKDEHYKEREMLKSVTLPDGRKVLVPGIVPKLSETPGDLEWSGPKLGQHNQEIFAGLLQLSQEAIGKLKEKGAI
ncbi:CaiB/BaiF CoA transferase family protein [Brevibacillus massiliensis]|jgi:crotonobetainyl-CoA:carnitine CoA-transferase CaiB-like acyl-CoA transferase|uniref:CaiB/BaiF CoA transferase family protein n=1 Tax=Brevibacillus massiliensis TaxID=1118054 RepID=UPI00031F4DDA|nr:CoA transferase [Brevibacillus massiliensis]